MIRREQITCMHLEKVLLALHQTKSACQFSRKMGLDASLDGHQQLVVLGRHGLPVTRASSAFVRSFSRARGWQLAWRGCGCSGLVYLVD